MDLNGTKREVLYDKGLASRILSFVRDDENLWFSSSEGIFFYNNKEDIVRKFTTAYSDLLMGYYDRQQKSIIWGGNDCLIYQTVNNRIKDKGNINNILVTSIYANGVELIENKDYKYTELSNGGEIRLFSRTNVTLELSNFSYATNGNHEFYYSIDDDKEWAKIPNGQNLLTLAGLSGGKHCLKVSDCIPQAEKSLGVSSFTIVVPFPWYCNRTALFVYACVLIVTVFIFITYLQKLNRRKFERKERERFLELSSLKMDFFVNISHELKTPLSLVIAPLGKLASEIKDKNLKSRIERININALHLSALINKILDFNKLEYESEETLIRSQVDICQVIKNSIKNLSPICEQRQIKISFITDIQHLVMDIDVLKIESIISNLLSNAIRYVANYTGLIEITLSLKKDFIILHIHDNGPGVDEKDLPYVFIRYFQSSKVKTKGSGIGLYLVKKFVELHGGNVNAKNDNGFTVTINLPIHGNTENTKETQIYKSESENSYSEGCEKKSILIIDDNKEIVDFLSEALSESYNCMKAYDGDDGIRITEELYPDLVIVDQMMPQISGIDYVRHIRHNIPTANIPIIMLTAKDDYNVEVESIKTGVDVFMSKPFDLKKLLLYIVRLLKKQETMEKCMRVEKIASPDFSYVENIVNPDELLLEKITNSIENNMAKEGFNLKDLSDDVGISQKQLYRKVKQLTGMTPISYFRKLRMKKAYALLRSQSNLTITEVLYMIGISNATYFNKCFIEEFGITPKELIRQTKLDKDRQN